MPDLNALFRPRSIALVGASPDPGIIRGRMVNAIRRCGFAGPVWCVSRSHREIGGFPAVPSVAELPEPADLALVTIPAEHVPAALEACGRRGIRAAVIISSGFAEERGEAGRARQSELREIIARYDLAVLGPNGEGFMNAAIPLTATFSPVVVDTDTSLLPAPGRGRSIAVVSQSGGIGFSFFDRGRPKELPFSFVVTTGNEAGLDVLDVTDYLLDDGTTGVVIVFLEGLRAPAKLPAVAEKAARLGKPLVVAKMGRSEAGVRGAASHTASLAGSWRAYRGVLAHHGIVEGEDVEQMVDVAGALARWDGRLPAGRRVAVLTPSGGAGIWLADAATAAGLEVPELDAATREAVDALLPAYGSSVNPVDVTAQVIFRLGYGVPLEIVARSPEIDAVLVACSLAHPGHLEHDVENLVRLGESLDKPVVFCAYTRVHPRALEILARAGFPCMNDMPNAARGVLAGAAWAEHRRRRAAAAAGPSDAGARRRAAAVAADLRRTLGERARRTLTEHEAKARLARLGLPVPPGGLARSADEAVSLGRGIGGPVALKAQAPALAHKTDAGAVALGVEGEREIVAAYERVHAAAGARAADGGVDGVRVEAMAPSGVEMLVGVVRDADFGPMVMVGSGGVLVEVLDDVALAPVPLDRDRAAALVDRLAGARLLSGVRGAPPADREALEALLVAVSHLASAAADVLAELDLNPVLVHARGEGVTVADALLVLERGEAAAARSP